MKKSLCLILLLYFFQFSFAQKEDRNWVFGVNCGIDFNDLNNPTTFKSNCYNLEANASISDKNGELLFYLSYRGNSYFSPLDIRNKSNDIIENGDSIFANLSSSNGILILPFNDLYYIIYQRQFRRQHGCPDVQCDHIYYSVVFRNNSGKLEVKEKNQILLEENIQESLVAIKHANGLGWWVIARKRSLRSCTNEFFLIHVKENGSLVVKNQNIGPKSCGAYGEIATSINGSNIAFTGFFYLSDSVTAVENITSMMFNRCNGDLSDVTVIDSYTNGGLFSTFFFPYGIEFSPSAEKMYVGSSFTGGLNSLNETRVTQYDLVNFSKREIETIVYNSSDIWPPQLELGPDGKIYIGYGFTKRDTFLFPKSQYLSVINNPDAEYSQLQTDSLSFFLGDTSRVRFGLPNMPNYNLEPISIYKADAGKDTILCSNYSNRVKLGVSEVNGVDYWWTSPSGLNSYNIAQPIAFPEESGWYYLTLTDTTIKYSCQSRTDSVYVKVENCTSIGNIVADNKLLSIYPNPANENLNFKYSEINSRINKIELFDLQGKTVLISIKSTINIEKLSPAIYFYKVQIENGEVFIGKFIKNNF